MRKIDNCPFCGSSGKVIEETGLTGRKAVCCSEDGDRLCHITPCTAWHLDINKAIVKWNKRPYK